MSFVAQLVRLIIIGIVEGITEWLPISSTGHMILVDKILPLRMSETFSEIFFVVIQLGAILAVPVLFFRRLSPFSSDKGAAERKATFSLWKKVLVGVIPAAVVGFLLDDFLDKYFYSARVVALMLIFYGVIFIVIERRKRVSLKIESVESLSYSDAFKIGLFQVLSLVPGTSRSGSTILGALIVGTDRSTGAEFSFFMAIPIMLGASLLKVLKFFLGGSTVAPQEWLLLFGGMLVSFFVSLISIKFLMDFVKRHSFTPFGIYRIILGIVVLICL